MIVRWCFNPRELQSQRMMSLQYFHILAVFSLLLLVIPVHATSETSRNTMDDGPVINIVKNETDLIGQLWQIITLTANESIHRSGRFKIGVSGGSMINLLASGAGIYKTDWSKWRVFLCDERYVDEDSKHSTFGELKKVFLPKTKMLESQIFKIDRSKNLVECARSYAAAIRDEFCILEGVSGWFIFIFFFI